MTLRTQIEKIIDKHLTCPLDMPALLDEIMPVVEGKPDYAVSEKDLEEAIERNTKAMDEECGALIHTRGWEGAPGPIYCANKKPCHLHEQEVELVSHPLEEGWAKRFDKEFKPRNFCCGGDFCDDEDHINAVKELKSFISQTLAQERKKWEMETIGNWAEKVKPEQLIFSDIEKARQEERAKVVEEVHKAVMNAMDSLNEIRDKKMGIAVKVQTNDSREISLITGEMGETMLNSIVKDTKKILLSLLKDLQVNKERE